jgi:hypothetical protein
MIYIEKGAVNKVVLTLWESATIDDPYYCFQLTNLTTGAVVRFIAPDSSGAPAYFNLFSIVEQPSGTDPLNGIVELSPAGQWEALIYESATDSLDPDDWGRLLQKEMAIVAGEDQAINPIYQ